MMRYHVTLCQVGGMGDLCLTPKLFLYLVNVIQAPVRQPTQILSHLADAPIAFWLDSGLNVSGQGERSFWGSHPSATFRSHGEEATVVREDCEVQQTGNPLELLTKFIEEVSGGAETTADGLPVGLSVGYIAYEVGRLVEPYTVRAFDDLGLPEIYFAYYDEYCALDDRSGAGVFVRRGEARPLKELPFAAGVSEASSGIIGESAESELVSNFSRASYTKSILEAKEYIAAGDIYQVNLSQRFSVPLLVKPESLYLNLRDRTPAPFGAFMKFPGFTVLSNSPERFLRFDPATRRIQTRPIKGTRPRGTTHETDVALAEELLASEKDRAENIMIVDLERNDIGRVCKHGSVVVTEQWVLETFPTVFHLTSTVEGTLAGDKGLLDLLKATFPGGSITGAPKIRAMEIIDELEPTRRSIYTGCIGYIATDGSLDLNIAIRTAIQTGNRLYFQAGGAIVADSNPEDEYEETLTKALAWKQAIERSQPTRDTL
ncbi:MAG: aminodeoxychorismate synthase, component I [Armatimonadetes bacterium CG_4_10_14_3_um_filter_59_10]|nr:MAG: aminodeoxychorismate synthase, component I [Armatimonadetes bacterium CG_4_8_14_3_um_filter_58_9]PIY41828.1 MAG: aminodeoxychorismate synthase, component I [Armatimonadetes bacterium CG_4_10_14_3_um_filter_59_10]PJB63668.1 MAG: aminodeoxychorismate synthase, component I [Armatimonadetes bacterium CG_4_9_14_3_um_filter_58_7]